jgi:sialate O-acetylesterase
MKRIMVTVLMSLMLAGVLQAQELRLVRYYSDNMVLQRDKETVVRGSAPSGASVTVSFAGQQKTGKADDAGQWAVTLEPLSANAKGTDLTVVSGKDKATIKDVVVGDVILFARQTSVDITLGRDDEGKEAAKALKKKPNFRAISIRTIPTPYPQADMDEKSTAGWRMVDSDTALAMSAAAYYLGRDLASASDVPVGIIDLNMGYHFPISWISKETLLHVEPLVNYVRQLEEAQETYEKGGSFEKKVGHIRHWVNEKLGVPVDHPFFYAAGYNAVMHPVRGLGVKGVLLQLGNDYPYMFYEKFAREGKQTDLQSLNNAYRLTYETLKYGNSMEPAVIPQVTREWRRILGGDHALPIAFVSPPASDLWPYAVHNTEMRELQRLVAAKEEATDIVLPGIKHIPFSGQPADEALLAERSLKWVRGRIYGDESTAATGPDYDRFETDGAQVVIHFKPGTAKGLKADEGALDNFEVADVDGEYKPATAEIDGETIRLTCDAVDRIFSIQYNYTDRPDQGLVNAAGLPAIPFRTKPEQHRWLVRYRTEDEPDQFTKLANEWEGGDVTLISGKLERGGYRDFSGNFGPIGISGGPFGPNIGVRSVTSGSPAYGRLFPGDFIYSANGKLFGERSEMILLEAITECEATDGKLVLGVRRGNKLMDVELHLDVLGRYSSTSPWNCPKTDKIVFNLENWLEARGGPGGYLTSDQMFLLGAGSPQHQWMVRKYVNGRLGGEKKGDITWILGSETIFLSEYFLSTGDKRVLPAIKGLVDRIVELQINEDNNRNGGWYGRGGFARGYPAMPHAGLSCMLGMTLAKECGVDVPEDAYARGLAYFERKGARYGQIIYGDAYRNAPVRLDPAAMWAGRLDSGNGKIPKAAVFYQLIGDEHAAYTCSLISTYGWYSTRFGHGGNWWNDFWTPLGAAVHSKESFIYFMKNHRWYREAGRSFDGSLLCQDRWGASTGLALVVPRRRMRMLGAPQSPFAPGAPVKLTPALFAYDARDYKLAESLALALLDDITLAKKDKPTVQKLAVEAKRMQESITSDLAVMQSLIAAGERHKARLILSALEPVIATDDPRLAEVQALLNDAKARPNDQALYEASLGGGASEADDASKFETSEDVEKARKATDAASEAAMQREEDAKRRWITFTPRPRHVRTYGWAYNIAPDPENVLKWRMKVFETLDNAPQDWMSPAFDDSNWTETELPISWHLNHSAILRTTFHVEDAKAYDQLRVSTYSFRQQNVKIYLNGILIARMNHLTGNVGRSEFVLNDSAVDALKNGENTLAVCTRNNWRWGMRKLRVYNDGFDFYLDARPVKGELSDEELAAEAKKRATEKYKEDELDDQGDEE